MLAEEISKALEYKSVSPGGGELIIQLTPFITLKRRTFNWSIMFGKTVGCDKFTATFTLAGKAPYCNELSPLHKWGYDIKGRTVPEVMSELALFQRECFERLMLIYTEQFTKEMADI